MEFENLCDGGRRRVLGKRHKLKTAASGHTKAECPLCKRVLVVTKKQGVLEFPRHERPKK